LASRTGTALGHHDPVQTLEAFNRYARQTIGLDDVTDGLAPPEQWPPMQTLWAVLREHCDERDDPDHDPDCYECRNIEEAGWWLDWSATRDTDSAFPIMVLSF
jgi:hypothetical protein